MIITFHKNHPDPDTLTCIRPDGTTLHETLPPGCVFHDLAHLVVESRLAYTEGVFGMIAQGHAIDEYSQTNDLRTFQLSPQAYHAEFLSTLVQSAAFTGQISPAYLEMLQNAATQANLPFPQLPDQPILQACLQQTRHLTERWIQLPPQSALTLTFPLEPQLTSQP